MAAGIFTWVVNQGSTFVGRVQVRNKDTKIPEDLTGYTFRMQVRKNAESDVILLEASTALGNINLDGPATDGIIAIQFSDIEMGLDTGKYVYDIEYTSVAGDVDRIIQGFFVVDGEVTR
jgi:hypothetical protein